MLPRIDDNAVSIGVIFLQGITSIVFIRDIIENFDMKLLIVVVTSRLIIVYLVRLPD